MSNLPMTRRQHYSSIRKLYRVLILYLVFLLTNQDSILLPLELSYLRANKTYTMEKVKYSEVSTVVPKAN